MKIFELTNNRKSNLLFEKLDPIKKQEYLANNMTAKIINAAKQDHSIQKLHLDLNRKDITATALSIVQALTQADPSPGFDYLNFITRMYVAGQFKMEDLSKIKQELELFTKVKNKLQNKDINSYQKLDDLYNVVEPFVSAAAEPEPESHKAEVKKMKKEEAQKVIDTLNFKVIIPKTFAASCLYGSGTKWCTTGKDNEGLFNDYSQQGPLYIIMAKDKTGKDIKYQFHIPTNQYMNARDQEITKKDILFLSKFPEYKSFLDALIKKNYFGK